MLRRCRRRGLGRILRRRFSFRGRLTGCTPGIAGGADTALWWCAATAGCPVDDGALGCVGGGAEVGAGDLGAACHARCSPWGPWWIIIADANGLASRNVANRSMSSGVPVLCDGITVRDHGMVLHSDQTNRCVTALRRRVTVIYVTSRKGHELATAGLSTVCTCENAPISCAFRTLLGFAAARRRRQR